jgi:2-dehydropantoate 2-reductase
MRFIIQGAGAIGTLVGGLLADSGAEVVLIARPAHAEAVNHNGVLIKSHEGERCVTANLAAVTHPAQLKPRSDDVIFLTVKTAQTEDSVHLLRDTFSEETPIVCLQNAVRNEEYAAGRFKRVYGAMVGVSATLLGPGTIAWTMNHPISLGNYPLGCDDFARALAAQLEKDGFRTTTNENIMAVKWTKLILNLNNATLSLLDSYVQLAQVLPELGRFMAEVMAEGLHVLEAAHISLDDPYNPFDLPAIIARYRAMTEEDAAIQAARELPLELRTYPSTWVDLKQQRGETEAGYFNGEIILLGEKYDVPTPYNTTLLNLVETLAVKRGAPGKYSLAELMGLVEQRRLMIYHS